MPHPLTSAYPRPPCSPLLCLAGPAWAHTRTSPPPVSWAQFSRNAAADLLASTHDSNELGDSILKPKMAEVLDKLKQQLGDANAQVADPESQLVLLASRAPKLAECHRQRRNQLLLLRRDAPANRAEIRCANCPARHRQTIRRAADWP